MTTIIKFDEIEVLDRGGAVKTWPLITTETSGGENDLATGISVYPVGAGAPVHSHNCDEQVLILEGEGFVEVDGVQTALKKDDTAYVKAGNFHRYHNTGEVPMRILWIYPQAYVTRTFFDTGETVEHLTAADAMGGRDQH